MAPDERWRVIERWWSGNKPGNDELGLTTCFLTFSKPSASSSDNALWALVKTHKHVNTSKHRCTA